MSLPLSHRIARAALLVAVGAAALAAASAPASAAAQPDNSGKLPLVSALPLGDLPVTKGLLG